MREKIIEAELVTEVIVACPRCGKKNRLRAETVPGVYRCGACHADLPRNPMAPQVRRSRRFLRRLSHPVVYGAAGVAILIISFLSTVGRSRARQPVAHYIPPALIQLPFNSLATAKPQPTQFTQEQIEDAMYPPRPLPNTGYRGELHFEPLAIYGGHGPPRAPFRVTVPSDGFHYWVKLRDVQKNHQEFLFVRSGESAEVKVDLGTYRVTYAVGKTWRGDWWRFGSETRYFKSDFDFDFYQDNNQVVGHTVELYPQIGGNLSTEPIKAADF